MAIDVACPCSMQFRAKEEFAGEHVECPGCGKPVLVPVPPMIPIVVDEEETEDEIAWPSAWSEIKAAVYRAVTTPPRPRNLVRDALGLIAVLSLLCFVWSQAFPVISASAYAGQLAYAKSRGAPIEIADVKQERRRKLNNVADDARTAWLTLTVALSGLAVSKK